MTLQIILPQSVVGIGLVNNRNRLNTVTLTDIINDLNTVHYFAEASVVAVEVRGVFAAVADKEL